jgi:hypothetical protein
LSTLGNITSHLTQTLAAYSVMKLLLFTGDFPLFLEPLFSKTL